jgi:hypothetical protein
VLSGIPGYSRVLTGTGAIFKKNLHGCGQAITHRTSQVCPIQPALPVCTTRVRPNCARRASVSCVVRERQVARPVSSRRAARSTEPPIARNCGVRRHLHPRMSEQQRTPALQGAPSPTIRAPRQAVPTAQARMTRARGLHATSSSIRTENHMSSLPEGRIAHRFFLFRWHRAHTRHTLNFRTATSAD